MKLKWTVAVAEMNGTYGVRGVLGDIEGTDDVRETGVSVT